MTGHAQPQGKSPLPLPREVIAHHAPALTVAMKEWRDSLRVPPVLLLTGLPGVGKRSMAFYLSQWLLCERSGMNHHAEREEQTLGLFGLEPEPAAESAPPAGQEEPHPCGECASCQKAVHGSWVDFEEITAAEGEETLKIEQFRKLKAKQGYGAHESDYRIILISDADRMTTQAANSVLKILEEPPKGWVFLLTASDSNLLLPTLVSRCQTLRLRPFTADALESLLGSTAEGVAIERRKLAARLAEGSWARAVEWTQDAAWKKRGELLDFIHSPQFSTNALVDWASTDTASFQRLLDQLESLTLDLIRFSIEAEGTAPETFAWKNADAARALSTHARSVIQKKNGADAARRWWLERAERIAQARGQLHAPLNRKLLVQDVLLPWLS
ncbi:MAG: hypothetical protein P4M08_07925 [Oligoflexia bacterium]|nr:hypothetical protein [Oligoflexia bacterium]